MDVRVFPGAVLSLALGLTMLGSQPSAGQDKKMTTDQLSARYAALGLSWVLAKFEEDVLPECPSISGIFAAEGKVVSMLLPTFKGPKAIGLPSHLDGSPYRRFILGSGFCHINIDVRVKTKDASGAAEKDVSAPKPLTMEDVRKILSSRPRDPVPPQSAPPEWPPRNIDPRPRDWTNIGLVHLKMPFDAATKFQPFHGLVAVGPYGVELLIENAGGVQFTPEAGEPSARRVAIGDYVFVFRFEKVVVENGVPRTIKPTFE